MKDDSFLIMLNKFQKNIEELYANVKVNGNTSTEEINGMLPAVYKELGTASEELQIAIEQLVVQSEELAATRINLEVERQHYKNLFEFLPDAYLVTNPQGQILQANQASGTLLNIESRFLRNKPLEVFLTPQERQVFPTKLEQLNRSRQHQKWTLLLQPRHGELFEVAANVAPSYNSEDKLVALHWSFHQLSQEQQIKSWLEKANSDLIEENSKYIYQQGEIIPLHPDCLWIVYQGWVKLSTITETGEEILIGLVGESMPFGSSLTALPTYQATALSQKAQLVCIPLRQIFNTPNSMEAILPHIIERLQQTESLLAISGVRQVNERIHHLLSWLKENFGQQVPQGYRLRVRLTHQEIANACGTTRVTITRVLSQLKKEGKIAYDGKHHIIFL